MQIRAKLAIAILLIIGIIPSAKAQTGASIYGQAMTPYGTPASNARIWVCPYTATGTPCTPTSTIYSDPNLTKQITQPYAADQYGNFTVFVDPGMYLVQVQINQTVYYSYTVSASNAGAQFLTLQHNGSSSGIIQTVVNNTDDGTIAPDSGYTLAKFLTNGTGAWAAEYLTGNFEMQVVPPTTGQYVVLYPTASAITQTGALGSGTISDTSGQFQWSCTGLTCDIEAGWGGEWSGFALPSGINPSSVTAVYADAYAGAAPIHGAYPSGGDADLSIGCSGSSANLLTLGPMAEISSLTTLTGPQISTASCAIRVGPSNAGASGAVVNAAAVRLIVYYTGTPVDTGNSPEFTGPLYVNTATNTIGIDTTYPFPGSYLNPWTVAKLPVTPPVGSLAVISDGASATDCTTGGGSNVVECDWNGSAWTVWAGGGGGSGFPITLGSTSIAASSTTTSVAGLTVDGVTPTTFGFVDPTSSIQTQLNAKPTISGTPATGNCVDWASATSLGDAGSPCGSGGGSGTVTDGSGTTTANQIATSTTTSHQIQYSTALPNGTTATTQTTGDNTTKVATDAFVLANAGGGGSLPSCTTNQLLYYASSGTTGTCLALGTNLSISSGTLNSTGGGSSVWSALTSPTANLALSMDSYTTTFTFGAATGSSDLLKWTDTTSNTGTGILGHFTTASGSSETPWQADVNGKGFNINPATGALTGVGFGSVAGSLTLPAGTAVSGLAGAAIFTSDTATGYAEVNENNTGNSRICTAANGVCGSGAGGSGMFAGIISVPTTTSTGLTIPLNQSGTFTATNSAIGITLFDSTSQSGTNLNEGIVEAYPATPFTKTILVSFPTPQAGYNHIGFVISNGLTATSNAFLFFWGITNGSLSPIVVAGETLNGSSGSNLATTSLVSSGSFMWLRYTDDGTNIYFYYSTDGVTWSAPIYTVAKSSSYLGSGGFTYFGLHIEQDSGAAGGATVMSWQ